MAFWKKDSLEKYDNQIGKLQQEELELSVRIEDIKKQEIDLLNERKDVGIKKYISVDKRRNILEEARKLGYSLETIEELRTYIDYWSQDNVTNDIIDEFENMCRYIEKQAPYKKSLLYQLGGKGENEGGDVNDN